MKKKRISILGSTGQLGQKALEIVVSHPELFELAGIACGHDSKQFRDQIKKYKPKKAVSADKDGDGAVVSLAASKQNDLVFVAVVGLAGLKPTLAAIEAGKNVALATKEVLVVAGEYVCQKAKEKGGEIIPVDSEHSALFQASMSGSKRDIRKIHITMGSGNLAKMSKERLKSVTTQEVFSRKTWQMGPKIAVDSATGINKVFEVIEAKHLFNLTEEQIELVVHPEYLFHSFVEFVDGSFIAEIGVPDMSRYIQYAFSYPQRVKNYQIEPLSLLGKKLTLKKPPYEKFPCLKLSSRVLRIGGACAAVLHGADRVAVEAFINHEIGFTQIYDVLSQVLDEYLPVHEKTIEQLIKAEEWGGLTAKKIIKNINKSMKGLVA